MTNAIDLASLDAVAQAELIQKGELQPKEVLEATFTRLEHLDPLIHGVVAVDRGLALGKALALPKAPNSPLFGVPLPIKDVVPYPGLRAAFGVRGFARNVAQEGVPFTARLDAAGMVVFGKTASSELGLLGSTETLLEGVTHNPWDLSRSAAGSSGGAAAVVAAGIVPLAHASDGGGSIRIPASVTGLFGFKPSRGRCAPTVPGGGDFAALVSDLAVARSVRDVSAFLSITETRDGEGPYPPVGFIRAPSTTRLRIGAWSTTLMGQAPEPEVLAAYQETITLLRGLGHTVLEIEAPGVDGPAVSRGFFTLAGAAMNGFAQMIGAMLGRAPGPEELEPFTLALIQHFQAHPALEQAQRDLAQAAERYRTAIGPYDVVLTPTIPRRPWPLGTLNPTRPYEVLIEATETIAGYTPIHNVAGCPAMSVPLGWTAAPQVLPIGLHFAAQPGQDGRLLALAFELEQAQPWAQRWAPYSVPALFGGQACRS